MTTLIRQYQDGDRDFVYDVCVETGDAGRGVRGRYRTDDLLPDIFAGPYLALEPQHAYVLDNGDRAVGYVIGTASTADFVAAYKEQWLPRMLERYQPPSGPPATEEDYRLDAMFHPERLLRPWIEAHPAHLHVNVLAGYRGSGYGRELITTFLASVAAAGAASCFLQVRKVNVQARRFYAKTGWTPIDAPGEEPGTVLVHPAIPAVHPEATPPGAQKPPPP